MCLTLGLILKQPLRQTQGLILSAEIVCLDLTMDGIGVPTLFRTRWIKSTAQLSYSSQTGLTAAA